MAEEFLYTQRLQDDVPDGFVVERNDDALPATRIRPADGSAALTVLCYGGILSDVEQAIQMAFDEQEIACEVLCPLQLYPLNPWPIVDSVRRTGRLLVVEEGLTFSAFGAEVVSQICELAPGSLHRVKRLGAPRHPIPSCGPLEKQLLPGEGAIARAIVEICGDR